MPELLLEPAFLAQLDRLTLVSRRLRAGQMQAERRSPNRGSSVEFADFRTYAPGDDFRMIDWNAFARLEKLFLKLFVAEEDLTIHVLLDGSRSMVWGEPQKWRYAQRLAAALGYIALVGMDRVTGAALGCAGEAVQRFRPVRGKKQALLWFTWLASLNPGAAVRPEVDLRAYAAQAARPGPLVIISDLLGEGWRRGLRTLAGQGFELSILHLLAPQELDPALEGDVRLVDVESLAGVEITADFDLLRRYQERLQAWRAEWSREAAALGAHYVPISTAEDLQELMLAYLRRYDVVR